MIRGQRGSTRCVGLACGSNFFRSRSTKFTDNLFIRHPEYIVEPVPLYTSARVEFATPPATVNTATGGAPRSSAYPHSLCVYSSTRENRKQPN